MCENKYINIQTGEELNLLRFETLADNAMLKVKPELWVEWDFEKNNEIGLDIYEVTKGQSKKAWWVCSKCKNNINVVINTRASTESKCAYCSGRIATKTNSLAYLFPHLLKEWHPVKNGELSPDSILPHSHRKIWWVGSCGHEWETNLSNRTKPNPSNCPYCSGQKVCEDNSLSSLNSKLSSQWHPTKNEELTPQDVTCGSSKKAWWICEEGHEWNARISSRHTNELGCPYCTNQKTLINFNNINYTNKLMSSALVNKEDGDKYTQGSNLRVEFKCPTCNNYLGYKAICDVFTYGLSCSNCSDGKSYPEKFMSNLLTSMGTVFKNDIKFSWSNNKRYDFYFTISNVKYIVEMHGGQHYNGKFSTLNGNNVEEEVNNDLIKKKMALDNNIDEYIIIDARYSKFEWLKSSILKSGLASVFNLLDVNWEDIELKSSKSILIEVCEEYNNDNVLVKELSKKYNLARKTIYDYLDRGFALGLTDYKRDKEKIPDICNQHAQVEVVKLDLNGGLLNSYTSISNAVRDLGVYNKNEASSISLCCKGKLETSLGFKWMYKEDYEKQYSKIS